MGMNGAGRLYMRTDEIQQQSLFPAAERIQLDSTSRAAIASAVDIVTSGVSNSRPASASCRTGLAFANLDLERARVGRSERIALWLPASRNQQYTVGVAA